MAPLLMGIDGGTEGLRVSIFTPSGQELAAASASYPTRFPGPGQAEQFPEDWWRALCEAVPEAMRAAGVQGEDIAALALDTTCCTVCLLDASGGPLRPALLWMDVRSSDEATAVLATGDAALSVNNAARGPVSAEWMIPKAVWLRQNEPRAYEQARYVCEYQDFLNFRLTGRMVASANNTGVRWHFRHAEGGPPLAMLKALGAADLAEKWPGDVLMPGDVIAPLTTRAAEALSLSAKTLVVQGGADAFIAMAGLGIVRPGGLALVTGSSHLHLAVTEAPCHAPGMWGGYGDVLRRGSFVVEGGQTSTGSVISWFRRTVAPGLSYAALDAEAAEIPIGCDGVTAQDHFQGNRTPYTDALSRGAFLGLSLTHERGHMYRALLESVAFGTRLILETMEANGVGIEEIVAGGGVTRSPLWLQMHADVTGRPIRLAETGCAPALGSAVFAAVGLGLYPGLDEAAAAMVRIERVVEPDRSAMSAYEAPFRRYRSAYRPLSELTASRATP